MKEYTIIIYLDHRPLPKLGDKFIITKLEDHTGCPHDRSYILATLEPFEEKSQVWLCECGFFNADTVSLCSQCGKIR